MPWLDDTPPEGITKIKRSGKKIKWESSLSNLEMDKPWQFVVYFNEEGQEFNPEKGTQIYKITKKKELKFQKINRRKKKYEIRVSVLDRLNNESIISEAVSIKL
jgi:hypothetical protein